MKGLKALLDFIYFGRLIIKQEELEEFMILAKHLQITGLNKEEFNGSIEYATDIAKPKGQVQRTLGLP